MYFSTVPPSFSMRTRSWLNAAPRAALSRSGPRRTVCCVEPTTSMKRHATSRRSSRRSTRPEASPDASACLRLALCLPRRRRDPFARDGGLFDVTRARKPALDALGQPFRPVVLDRDGETGQVRGERTSGEDVSVVLARVAVDGEAPHRGVARVLERTKTEVIEELLARVTSTDGGAAFRTGREVGGRASGASPPAV